MLHAQGPRSVQIQARHDRGYGRVGNAVTHFHPSTCKQLSEDCRWDTRAAARIRDARHAR